jgi:predicted dehydrogenase
VEEMRAVVAAGDLGEVLLVHGRYVCDDALHPASGWRLQREASGPSYVVGDLGTHWLDAAEYVTGLRVEAVLAEFRTHDEQRTELEETALLLLRLGGSCAGTAAFTAVTAGRKNQLLLECEGTRGGLTWDQERPDELLRRHADRPTELALKDGPLAHYPAGHAEGYGEAFENILGAAYRAIAGKPNEGYATLEDGYRGVALVEAAVASAAGGDWVEPRPL